MNLTKKPALLNLFALLLLMAFAQCHPKHRVITAKLEGGTNHNLAQIEKNDVDSITTQQLSCTESTVNPCGVTVATVCCATAACTSKIVCCHSITPTVFNSMTANGSTGNGTFTATEINGIVDNGDCSTEHVMFAIQNNMYAVSLAEKPHNISSTAYYSIELVKGILARKPISITLFAPADGNETKLVPLRANYLGTRVEYYDVSDSEP